MSEINKRTSIGIKTLKIKNTLKLNYKIKFFKFGIKR